MPWYAVLEGSVACTVSTNVRILQMNNIARITKQR